MTRVDFSKLPVVTDVPFPTPESSMVACRNCVYYDPTSQIEDGEDVDSDGLYVLHYESYEGEADCKRYPKILHVHETHWCGEFKAR